MLQVDHSLPIQNIQVFATGIAWDTIASLRPANNAEELVNDFVWLLMDN